MQITYRRILTNNNCNFKLNKFVKYVLYFKFVKYVHLRNIYNLTKFVNV